MTLQHAGCKSVLMTTTYPQSESYWLFHRLGRIAFHTQVATRTRLTRIIGRPQVQSVELENLDTGDRRTVACDTVILTGDWIPDNELARAAGIPLDPASKSPIVDTALRTTLAGVFAIGNLLHPVDTADIAAMDGAAVAQHVRAYLDGRSPSPDHVQLVAEAPFRWVAPSLVRPGDPAPPRNRLLLWTDEYVPIPKLVLRQDNRVIVRKRIWWPAAPGRVFRVPFGVLDSINTRGGPITIGIDR